MRILDIYIGVEWLKTFLLSLAAILGILILEDMYDDLEDLLDYNATFVQILRYYLVRLPSFLPAVIPIALLISLLFCLGTLHRNHEIVSMQAAGLNLLRITRVLWFCGAVLSLSLLLLNAKLVPWSVEKSRILYDNLEFASEAARGDDKSVGLIYNLSFDNAKENRLWFMNRFSQYTFQGFGINVFSRDAQGRERSRIAAREGYYDDIEGFWIFQEGREVTFDPEEGEAIRSLPFEERSIPEFTEKPKLMMSLSKEPKDLSFFEIAQLLDKISPEDNPAINAYAVRYQNILANPFICLVAVAVAIPLAGTGVRTSARVGALKSVILFFAYYLLSSISIVLGERMILSPIVAAWVPNVIMLGVTGFLYRRARFL